MIDLQQIVRESLKDGMTTKQIDRLLHDMGWEQGVITEAIEACMRQQTEETKYKQKI